MQGLHDYWLNEHGHRMSKRAEVDRVDHEVATGTGRGTETVAQFPQHWQYSAHTLDLFPACCTPAPEVHSLPAAWTCRRGLLRLPEAPVPMSRGSWHHLGTDASCSLLGRATPHPSKACQLQGNRDSCLCAFCPAGGLTCLAYPRLTSCPALSRFPTWLW